MFSTSVVVPKEGLEVTGTPKTFTKTVDSGHGMTSFFCGDCGSTLYRESDGIPGIIVIKVGLIDGNEEDFKNAIPEVEQFTRSRVSWIPAVPGVEQVEEGWSPQMTRQVNTDQLSKLSRLMYEAYGKILFPFPDSKPQANKIVSPYSKECETKLEGELSQTEYGTTEVQYL